MEEWLEVYNEKHEKTGRAMRDEVHKKGLWHEVIHCWMICSMGGETWLYLQQRAFDKKDFPGWYDISSGGHVAEGESHEETVLREIYEELGIAAEKEKLEYLGMITETAKWDSYFNQEFAHVYLYQMDLPFFASGEEVERVIAVLPSEFLKGEQSDDPEWKITGMDLQGEPFTFCKKEFCSHPGEFETLVLPQIRKRIQTGENTR
ncbi:MAG: NUDIX hydrolase [Lachnospiraceae bacterium]